MQALFEGSAEAPDVPGLGVIPGRIEAFDASDKSVPHMGWNGATPLKSSPQEMVRYGFGGDASYYFVHTYRARYTEERAPWALTATLYGDEVFLSSVQKGNVFATQFHPEKSGQAGLNVLHAWLSQTGVVDEAKVESVSVDAIRPPLERNGFTKRIVACLDVRANDAGDLVVTKGDQYDVREASADEGGGRAVRNLGKPVDLARRYYDEGADEICFLNITSFRDSALRDQPMLDVVRGAAETVFVPLTIGGGIRDTVDPDGTPRSALEVASAYFRGGADKVSIGSDAVTAVEELLAAGRRKTGRTAIETISAAYGVQAVVVSIDPKRVYLASPDAAPVVHRPCVVALAEGDRGPNGEAYCWWQCTIKGGRETRDLDVVQLAQGAQALGAGELLLNSVDRDGSKAGFDAGLVGLVRRAVSIPLVASSGAGRASHFADVFEATDVEAALAAGIFHRKEVPIAEVKADLGSRGVRTRRDLDLPA
jgi:glutamine amidotransferase/cyclase